jgi:hypothetical protein
MAPEHFDPAPKVRTPEEAFELGPRSDIYSLGVTLYEMLVLRRPFEQTGQSELIAAIVGQEPPAPNQVDPRLPAELSAIVLQAMAKAPQRRYATAGALADDLERFLRHEAVAALPSLPYRSRVFVRKNRNWIALAATIAMAAFVSIHLAIRATAAERRAEGRYQTEQQHRAAAETARDDAERARLQEKALREEAVERERELSRYQRYRYGAHMSLALQDWQVGSLARVRELLDLYRPTGEMDDPRGFEWYYLSRLLDGDARVLEQASPVRSMAVSPKGDLVAIGAADGQVRLYSFPALGQGEFWALDAMGQEGGSGRIDKRIELSRCRICRLAGALSPAGGAR